mmetsp:Transcript_9104/g.13140  ORF Transcript_9104/g.13140 Transcript_9104/m.13140 type:complete len:837 (-) Transcript_9104:121-2631(-)
MAASNSSVASDTSVYEKGEKLRELLDGVIIFRKAGTKPQDNTRSSVSVIFSRGVKREEETAAWDPVINELKSLGIVEEEIFSEILLCEFDREMDVFKDERYHPGEIFKTFNVKDTTLNRILRLSPPQHIDNYIADNMPTYAASRNLYNTVHNTRLSDDSWKAFRKECASLRKPKDDEHRGYGLNQIKAVFTIRHGDREDTILATTVRMCPPLSAVTLLLKECRETLSFVDCPRWGWIPLQYAIQYQASPEVVSALIPTTDDMKLFSTFQQHDFLNDPDYRERTVLHWAGYYHAHLETIKALRKACSNTVLEIKDHCGHLPYETAIWHGSSADIIQAFYEPGLDGHPNFDSVLVKLMRSLTDITLKQSEGSPSSLSIDEMELENETTHYTYCTYNLPSIAARIAKSSRLQKEVEDRLVKTLPTFIRTADIIICVMMLISYHFCAVNFLKMNSTDWIYPLTVAAIYITGREIADLRANNIDWFFSIWNYFDVLTICLLVYSLCHMWVGARDDELNEGFETLVVVTTIFIWTNALTLLRSTFISLGSFVNGILRIAQVLVPFLMVSLFVLLLFGEVFVLGSLNSEVCQQSFHNTTDFCTFGNSLYTTYGQFVGGIELEDYDESSLMKILSGVFGLIVGIILLNVVIAIVSESWTGAVVESKEVFWHARMEFLMLSKLPTEESSLDKFLQGIDDRLSEICKPLWPSKDYWGVFDSFFDRMLSDDVGSFQWQIIFQIRTRLAKKMSSKLIMLKAALLLAIFFSIACIWFVIGLFSIGTLWPRPIRCFILSRSLPLENDLKENSNASNENKKGNILTRQHYSQTSSGIEVQSTKSDSTYQWN